MLKTQLSCEVSELVREIIKKSGKTYPEVENTLEVIGIYPELWETFITTQHGPIIGKEGFLWLEEALQAIFKELNINGIYITESI